MNLNLTEIQCIQWTPQEERSWYAEPKIYRENVKNYFIEHPELMKEIEEKIRAKFSEAFEKSLGDEEEDSDEEE